MPLSMHRISIPVFKQSLSALSSVLKKAETYCSENNIDTKDLLQKRLAPDMFTLTQQIQRATFHAAQAAAKLAGIDNPEFEDKETSFSDLQQRINYTIEILNQFDAKQFEGSENRPLEVQTRVGIISFIGQDFLLHFAIPQFLFHVTTAYGIIRNAGVEVGKRDFIGNSDDR